MPLITEEGRTPMPPEPAGRNVSDGNRPGADTALRASEKRQRQLIAALPVAVYTCDAEGRIDWCNEAAVELWGRRPVLGVDAWNGMFRASRPDGTPLLPGELPSARALHEGRSIRGEEMIFERPDGTRRRVLANPQIMRDDAGAVVGVVDMLVDVTDSRQDELDARRLAAIVESSEDAIIGTDLAGTITSWNGGAERLYGFSALEAIGQPLMMVIPPDRRDEESAILERVRRGEKIEPFETVRLCQDGSRIDVSLTVSPIKDAPGRIIGASKIARDITSQKRAMRALSESEERLRLATRAGKVGLWEWDIAANRVTWTDSLYEIHGVTRASFDATVEGFAALIHPDDRMPVERAIQSALKHDVPYELEFRVVRPAGGIVWVFTNAVVMRENGRPLRMLGATFDVTARKIAELALRDSEKRFRTLTSHAPVGIFLADAQGETVFVNESWSAMSGFTAAQASGSGWERAIHPDDRERVAAEWQAARGEQRASQAEYRFVRADGAVRWVQGNAVPLRDDAGRLAGYIGTLADVTMRKLAEEKLRDQQAQLRLISTNAPINLAHCNREGRFLFVNRANAQRFGRKPDEIVGRTIAEVMGEEALATIQPYIDRVLKGESIDYEVEVPYKGIGLRYMRVSYVPDFAEDGTVRGWLSAVSDISDRRSMENALRESEERFRTLAADLEKKVEGRTASLREAIVQMEEFSYSVSHDLRAPLRAMNAYAQALVEDYGGQLDDTAKSYLERIRRSSQRMETLTHDVLNYSRLARVEIELKTLNLEPILHDLIGQYAELQSPAADVSIETPLHRVCGHESSVGQCLANLLTNAAKFVVPGVRPRIRVRSEAVGENIRVWVEDNGIGIPPEYQGSLFRVFERVPTTHGYQGTGIGLAIVRKAVEKMGGRCGVESDGQHGSRFWIELAKG